MAPLLLAFLTAQTVPAKTTVEVLFVKVGPNARVVARSAGQERAVVLIHGLNWHPISKDKVSRALLRPWQQHDSTLVKEISRNADVYSLAYAQTAPCDKIAELPQIREHLRSLKKTGYRDIVLVGHSAGGLIARQFIEDHADAGVTKVIQVCSPNAGTNWAVLKAARAVQKPFVASLSHSAREHFLKERKDKRIPKDIQFACVVATIHLGGDMIVSAKSQWSPDLQDQGIPAHGLHTTHWDAVRNPKGTELLNRLVNETQKRWDESAVREARKKLLGG
jgi:pimeloyl-ACP methyl ester carboxylesterase